MRDSSGSPQPNAVLTEFGEDFSGEPDPCGHAQNPPKKTDNQQPTTNNFSYFSPYFKTMMLVRYLSQIGKYFLMWKEIFNKPTKWSVMRSLILKEIDDLVIGSLGIVAFISFFIM